jgi:hypothetical protein
MADDARQRLNLARNTKYQSFGCYNTKNAIASFGIIVLRSPDMGIPPFQKTLLMILLAISLPQMSSVGLQYQLTLSFQFQR